MVYDNLKTVVDTVFVGKERQFNRRFMTLANHYLFEPIACTPAAGWEKVRLTISENGYSLHEPSLITLLI